jgi:tetratricopeptide (TPR) repeat protein
VLQSQGDLAMRMDDLEGAGKKYAEAVELYHKAQDMVGLAYTLSELCYLSAKKGDMDKVIDYAAQAKEMLDFIPYESVKKYVAQKVLQAVALLGNDK